VLTHFIVADDVARSRDFYTGVLGGTAVMGGEPTIVKLDPPRRRLEGQPCQVRQVGAGDRARRRGRPSAQRWQVGQEGRVGKRGQPPDLAPLPRSALCRSGRVVAEGPAAARLVQEHVASATRRAGRGPTSATGDKARTVKLRGRGTGAWWIRAVEMKRLPTLAAARFPAATGAWRGHRLARRRQPPRRPGTTGQDPGGEGGVDAGLRGEAVAAYLAGATPSATVRFIPREQGNSKATQSAGRGSGRWT
jgi:hypothetical protein